MAPEQPGFTDVLEGRSAGMLVVNGRLEPGARGERTRPEIEIAIPGERAAAEIIYKLRHAIEFIRENIHKDISFHDIAAHLKMSAFNFARVFKHSTGHSPHQYIVRCRVNRATELLAETKLPITDVAFEVGYKTQSHFTTSFSRLVGVTPATFRAGK